MYHVAAFYHFTPLSDIAALKPDMMARGLELEICGTILLAPEGINSTIACPSEENLKTYMSELMAQFGILPQNLKYSTASEKPFGKFKIKLKREIITMNRGYLDAGNITGKHVDGPEWNDIIAQPDVLLLDTRNTYETEIGTFTGAIKPDIQTFTEFANYVDTLDPAKNPRIAMFCTGGIRCEKASSYMLQKGFREVYQLQGGILKYIENMKPADSKWQGDCFVFDERIALGHGLTEESYIWDDQAYRAVPVGKESA